MITPVAVPVTGSHLRWGQRGGVGVGRPRPFHFNDDAHQAPAGMATLPETVRPSGLLAVLAPPVRCFVIWRRWPREVGRQAVREGCVVFSLPALPIVMVKLVVACGDAGAGWLLLAMLAPNLRTRPWPCP